VSNLQVLACVSLATIQGQILPELATPFMRLKPRTKVKRNRKLGIYCHHVLLSALGFIFWQV
jgi:hypothetical protein